MPASAIDRSLSLRDRHWNVTVLPASGGSLQSCEYDGIAVLRPVDQPHLPDGELIACCYFPLIPFSNRVENGRFDFAGATVQLRRNVAGLRHSLHGHGWQAEWEVTEATQTACSLRFRHEATAEWPWTYAGTQRFELDGPALRIRLGIHNLSPTSMPCGLGFHPFFPAGEASRLRLDASHVWNGRAREFPRELVSVPAPLCFGEGALISQRVGTDHCFGGWRRRAEVTSAHSDRALVVEGCEETRYVVVYIPGASYFCVEPVTHAVNAMNLDDPAAAGLWTLEPGAARDISTSIRVEKRGAT